jgi:hypothetical protein
MRDADEVGAFVDGLLRRIVDPPREVTRAEKLAEARARARAREEARAASERDAKKTPAVPEAPPTPEPPSRALYDSATDERWWTSVDASARGTSSDDPPSSTSAAVPDQTTRAPTARRDERNPHKTVAAATTRSTTRSRSTTGSSSAARGKPGWRGGGTPVSARQLARRAASAAAAPPRKPRAPAPDEESLPWPPPRSAAAPKSSPLPARRRPGGAREPKNDAENIHPAGVRTRPRAFDDGVDVDRRPGVSHLARTVAASTRRASAAAATGVPKTIAEARCERCGGRNVCAAADATRPFQRGVAPPARERIGDGARRKTVTRTATPAAKKLAPCARCGRAWCDEHKNQTRFSITSRFVSTEFRRLDARRNVREDRYRTDDARVAGLSRHRSATDLRACSSCLSPSRRYCGAACAAADWETHRRHCAGTTRGYGPPGRGAETSLRGEREGTEASLRFMTTSIARGS